MLNLSSSSNAITTTIIRCTITKINVYKYMLRVMCTTADTIVSLRNAQSGGGFLSIYKMFFNWLYLEHRGGERGFNFRNLFHLK